MCSIQSWKAIVNNAASVHHRVAVGEPILKFTLRRHLRIPATVRAQLWQGKQIYCLQRMLVRILKGEIPIYCLQLLLSTKFYFHPRSISYSAFSFVHIQSTTSINLLFSKTQVALKPASASHHIIVTMKAILSLVAAALLTPILAQDLSFEVPPPTCLNNCIHQYGACNLCMPANVFTECIQKTCGYQDESCTCLSNNALLRNFAN